MSDIKLFKLDGGTVTQIPGESMALEKSLQNLIENNLEAFLGVRFLASEYTTSKSHAGRMDTLGIDENGCPVIIEYKRSTNQNVINQGLFYLDWLLDHKADFKLLVMEELGNGNAEAIEWSSPRLLCIAGDFSKYDLHAVQQMNRNIELIRYCKYGGELLLLDLVNATTAKGTTDEPEPIPTPKAFAKGIQDYIDQASTETRDLYESVKDFAENLGDDVQMKVLKWYIAFKRLKNFACVEVHPQKGVVRVFVKVAPAPNVLEEGFSKDVSNVGHYGTGDLELTLKTPADLEKAKPLIEQSYESN